MGCRTVSVFGAKLLKIAQMCNSIIVKSELLKLINEELSMGKIEALYFEEYIFLE